MKILYLHGFASKFDATSKKIKQLAPLGNIVGVDIDYCSGEEKIIQQLQENPLLNEVDLFIGTSMGGWLAAKLSHLFSLPFIALNPVIEPSIVLQMYIGKHKDYTGKDYYLHKQIVDDYTTIATDGCGLVLLDQGDELLDSSVSQQFLDPYYSVYSFAGGSHRFEHIPESMQKMEAFIHRDCLMWGISND